jgi:hypothetical protein
MLAKETSALMDFLPIESSERPSHKIPIASLEQAGAHGDPERPSRSCASVFAAPGTQASIYRSRAIIRQRQAVTSSYVTDKDRQERPVRRRAGKTISCCCHLSVLALFRIWFVTSFSGGIERRKRNLIVATAVIVRKQMRRWA